MTHFTLTEDFPKSEIKFDLRVLDPEEVTTSGVQAELAGVISTWNETYNFVPPGELGYVDYEAYFGWLPWLFVE